MYKIYLLSSAWTTIINSACSWECKSTFTLNLPNFLISWFSWIIDGSISTFFCNLIASHISDGFTDPYNSSFSVASFLNKKLALFILSNIDLDL